MVALKGVDERLATVLLAMDAANSSSTTHQELAAKIGSAREVVSRRLKHFESEGLIKLERGRVEVLNHASLQALCASD